jgi:hypothetical protein
MKAILVAALLLIGGSAAAEPAAIQVRNGTAEPGSGRLIIFARPIGDSDPLPNAVEASPYGADRTSVAAREIEHLAAGAVATVDGEVDSFPAAFSTLPPGRYALQAVLDRNHDYAYRGRREGGDFISAVVEARVPGSIPLLTLERMIPQFDIPQQWASLPPPDRAMFDRAFEAARRVDLVSPALSRFWGRPVHMQAWVALPPGYDPNARETYPVLYVTSGVTSSMATIAADATRQISRMERGITPRMIWVFLDHGSPLGPHEFVDSPNNGPWGTALVEEFIPHLERSFRMDAREAGRFLTGHSSGGWDSLWTLLHNPRFFGGTWSTAPDPVDFHAFGNVDLYTADNMYVQPDGAPIALARGEDLPLLLRDVARLEAVLGQYGGQLSAFEAVFSPRGSDGRPAPLFDRASGRIDPTVAARWREQFDISRHVEREWPRIGRHLQGKIHVIVGTADTFYLDAPVRLLQATLDRLGARSSFRYDEGRTHFDLYNGPAATSLMTEIAWAAYAVARPNARRPAPAPAAPAPAR